MRRYFVLFVFVASFIVSCNSDKESLDSLMNRGELTQALDVIEQRMQSGHNLEKDEISRLQKKRHDIEAVKEEYILTYQEVFEKLQVIIPDLSPEDIVNWEKDYSIEYYVIDGEKRYYYNCIFDLFQVNEEASERAKIEKKEAYDAAKYPLETIQAFKKDLAYAKHIHIAVRYFQDVSTMPDKALLKAWIPFVRANNYQSDIQILHSNIPNYILPDTESLTSMIYFEHEVDKSFNSSEAWAAYFTHPDKGWIKPMKKLPFVTDTTFVFQFVYRYKSEGFYKNIDSKEINPYHQTDKEYIKYTAETVDNQHTNLLKNLSEEIIGAETNSYIKARLIYTWICENITWTDPKPVLGDYAEYTAKYRRGDCSAKSNLFISLCRINHIPAKEQGGWIVSPGGKHAQHTWAQVYFQEYGWLPVDVTLGTHLIHHHNNDLKYFYFGNCTPYHMIIYDDKPYLSPAKKKVCIYGGGAQLGAFEWDKEDLEPYIQFDSYIE